MEKLKNRSFVAIENIDLYVDLVKGNPDILFTINVNVSDKVSRKKIKDIGNYLDKHFCYLAERRYVRYGKALHNNTVELEVTGLKTVNHYYARRENLSGITLAGNRNLFRNYNNKLVVGLPVIATSKDVIKISADSAEIEQLAQFEFSVKPFCKCDSINVKVECIRILDTVKIEKWHKVYRLPEPEIYLGSVHFDIINELSETGFLAMTILFAKYPPEIPIKAQFEVTSFEVYLDTKKFIIKGQKFSDEFMEAYDKAPVGAKVIFKRVVVDGPEKFELDIESVHVKTESPYKFANRSDIHW